MYIWKIHLEAIEGAEAAALDGESRRRLDPKGRHRGDEEVLMNEQCI